MISSSPWKAKQVVLGVLVLAGMGCFASGAQAAGGTAKPPKGAISPFVTPTLPDPTFKVNPALIHGFDVTGFIQAATANSTNAGCPNETDSSRFGGTVTLNNTTITIPCNLVVQLPANTFTWADFIHSGPDLSLGSGAPSFEIGVQGNVVDGTWIAGLAFVSQQSVNGGSGVISSIDYVTGQLHIDTGDPLHPATVEINDPNGRFGRPQSPDRRLSVDDANPTIHAATGYPMCVPRVHTDPTMALNPDDPICPQANRPKPQCRNFSQAGIAPPTSGELTPAPIGQVYCSQFVMPPAGGAAGDPNPKEQAPFEVGDYISYSGTYIGGPNPYISAHTIEANVGIYTQPGTQPSYLAIGEFGVGTADPNATAVNGAGQETQDRMFLESETTDVKTPVDIYMQDVDPNTGHLTNRWVTPFEMTGENATGNPSGGITTQYVGPQPQRARIRATKAPAGLLSQPSRMIKVAARTLCTPAGPDGQVALDDCFKNAPRVANGLVAGQYAAPVFEYIFPENVKPGDPIVPLDMWHLPFLRFGEGAGTPSDIGPSVGPLTPTPWGSDAATPPPSVPQASLSPASLTFAARDTGTTSAAQTITVTNTGNANLSISATALTGADGADFAIPAAADSCSATTIAPTATCTVDVTFSPVTAGAKSAALSLTDNAAGSPHTAALSATGTTPPPPPPPPAAVTPPTGTPPAGTPPTGTPPIGLPLPLPIDVPPILPPVVLGASTPPVTLAATNVIVPAVVSTTTVAPIIVGATVPIGATVLQVSVFSVPAGIPVAPIALAAGAAKAKAAKAGRRLIATEYHNAPKGKRRVVFRLTDRKLRHLPAGRYVVEVRVGKTRTALGPAIDRTVTITGVKR